MEENLYILSIRERKQIVRLRDTLHNIRMRVIPTFSALGTTYTISG
jgi:hypothetical protein